MGSVPFKLPSKSKTQTNWGSRDRDSYQNWLRLSLSFPFETIPKRAPSLRQVHTHLESTAFQRGVLPLTLPKGTNLKSGPKSHYKKGN